LKKDFDELKKVFLLIQKEFKKFYKDTEKNYTERLISG
jgi:hypothetical protein